MTTTIVTGANRGIGLEVARQLTDRGEDVIALVRNDSEELEALGIRVESGLDVGRDEVVEQIQKRIGDTPIDRVIHCAGILERTTFEDPDWDSMRRQFEVNTLGPLRVVKALHKNLRPGSRVGIVSSRVGSIEDNSSGGSYGYRVSKAAVNMVGKNLAHDLGKDETTVALLHPGYVRTEMTGGNGNVDPDEAAAGLIARMDELTPDRNGTFWHASGEELPW